MLDRALLLVGLVCFVQTIVAKTDAAPKTCDGLPTVNSRYACKQCVKAPSSALAADCAACSMININSDSVNATNKRSACFSCLARGLRPPTECLRRPFAEESFPSVHIIFTSPGTPNFHIAKTLEAIAANQLGKAAGGGVKAGAAFSYTTPLPSGSSLHVQVKLKNVAQAAKVVEKVATPVNAKAFVKAALQSTHFSCDQTIYLYAFGTHGYALVCPTATVPEKELNVPWNYVKVPALCCPHLPSPNGTSASTQGRGLLQSSDNPAFAASCTISSSQFLVGGQCPYLSGTVVFCTVTQQYSMIYDGTAYPFSYNGYLQAGAPYQSFITSTCCSGPYGSVINGCAVGNTAMPEAPAAPVPGLSNVAVQRFYNVLPAPFTMTEATALFDVTGTYAAVFDPISGAMMLMQGARAPASPGEFAMLPGPVIGAVSANTGSWQSYKWQQSGNFVGPYGFAVQSDGNLVIYGQQGNPVWTSQTNNMGIGPYTLTMMTSGTLALVDVYNLTLWSMSPSTTAALPVATSAPTSLGCYADQSTRALPYMIGGPGNTYHYSYGMSGMSSSMSAEICNALASHYGYAYFGLQYGSQCWAGNNYTSATQYGGSSSCNMACSGNSAETCGGSYANSLYQTNSGTAPIYYSGFLPLAPQQLQMPGATPTSISVTVGGQFIGSSGSSTLGATNYYQQTELATSSSQTWLAAVTDGSYIKMVQITLVFGKANTVTAYVNQAGYVSTSNGYSTITGINLQYAWWSRTWQEVAACQKCPGYGVAALTITTSAGAVSWSASSGSGAYLPPFNTLGLYLGQASTSSPPLPGSLGSSMGGPFINNGKSVPAVPFLQSTSGSTSTYIMSCIDGGYLKMVEFTITIDASGAALASITGKSGYTQCNGGGCYGVTTTSGITSDLVLNAWGSLNGFTMTPNNAVACETCASSGGGYGITGLGISGILPVGSATPPATPGPCPFQVGSVLQPGGTKMVQPYLVVGTTSGAVSLRPMTYDSYVALTPMFTYIVPPTLLSKSSTNIMGCPIIPTTIPGVPSNTSNQLTFTGSTVSVYNSKGSILALSSGSLIWMDAPTVQSSDTAITLYVAGDDTGTLYLTAYMGIGTGSASCLVASSSGVSLVLNKGGACQTFDPSHQFAFSFFTNSAGAQVASLVSRASQGMCLSTATNTFLACNQNDVTQQITILSNANIQMSFSSPTLYFTDPSFPAKASAAYRLVACNPINPVTNTSSGNGYSLCTNSAYFATSAMDNNQNTSGTATISFQTVTNLGSFVPPEAFTSAFATTLMGYFNGTGSTPNTLTMSACHFPALSTTGGCPGGESTMTITISFAPPAASSSTSGQSGGCSSSKTKKTNIWGAVFTGIAVVGAVVLCVATAGTGAALVGGVMVAGATAGQCVTSSITASCS